MSNANENHKHRYDGVGMYTQQERCELSSIIPHEPDYKTSKAFDHDEPESHKAWRQLMRNRVWIYTHIESIRMARQCMGKKLTTRGQNQINRLIAEGYRWYRPRAQQSEIDAAKKLADCLEYRKELWAKLRSAEEAEDYIQLENGILAFAGAAE